MSNRLSFYHYFVGKGLLEEVNICLKANCNINMRTNENDIEVSESSALHLATKAKSLEMVQLLLE